MFNSSFPDRVAPTRQEPNLVGDRYGRLTLVEEVAEQGCCKAWRKWVVRCDCGAEKQVRRSDLRSGRTVSCGCYMREISAANGRARETHGLSKHPLSGTHSQMLKRCYNPENGAYKNYGGRGIPVCERWHSVENFIADMAPSHRPGLSLERLDNELGYSPENCVWATRLQQSRNKRSNRLVSFRGRAICLTEACEITGLPYPRVLARLRRNWSIPRALGSENFSESL